MEGSVTAAKRTRGSKDRDAAGTHPPSKPASGHHGGGSVLGGQSSVGSDSTYSRALNATRLASAERSLFLAVYSMLSSNSLKDKIQAAAFVIEPVQLLATNFAVTASVLPVLLFDPSKQVVARFFADAAVLLSTPFTGGTDWTTSYTDMIICLALTCFTLLCFVYVGYRLSFSSTSPESALLALRVVAMVESSVLFMPTVEVFMRYALLYTAADGSAEFIAFPGRAVDVGLSAGAWALLVVFVPICVVISTVAVDVQGLFGMSHGRAELRVLMIKLLLVVVQQLTPVTGSIAAAFLKLALAALLLYWLVQMQPYNVKQSNMFRTAGVGLFVWTTLVEVSASLGAPAEYTAELFLLGAVPAMSFGAWLSKRRWDRVISAMPTTARLWEMVDSEDQFESTLQAALVLDDPTDLDIAARHVLTPPGCTSGFLKEKHERSLVRLLGMTGPADRSGGMFDSSSAGSLGSSVDGLHRDEDVAEVDGKLIRIGAEERFFLVHWLFQRAVTEQGDSSRLWTAYFNFVHWAETGSRMRMSAAALARINSLDLRFSVFRYLVSRVPTLAVCLLAGPLWSARLGRVACCARPSPSSAISCPPPPPAPRARSLRSAGTRWGKGRAPCGTSTSPRACAPPRSTTARRTARSRPSGAC